MVGNREWMACFASMWSAIPAGSDGREEDHLVEHALRHHLAALDRLPADAIVHPKLVVMRRSGATILRQVRSGKPVKALRGLMRGTD